MSKKLYKSGYIKVGPGHEIDLEPIGLEVEARGVIHGSVKGVEGKTCVVKLFKIKLSESKESKMIPIAFQYVDNWGQFLFPISDTDCSSRYVIKVFCLEPDDFYVDPNVGNCEFD